jgi:hypothetical protein
MPGPEELPPASLPSQVQTRSAGDRLASIASRVAVGPVLAPPTVADRYALGEEIAQGPRSASTPKPSGGSGRRSNSERTN